MKYSKTWAFLFGALSVYAFAPHYVVALSFVSFSLLMFLLLYAKSGKQAFSIAYSFGFAHFAFGLIWIGNALLIEPDKFGWLYPFVFIGAGGFFGLFFAIPGWISVKAASAWKKWIIFTASFVLFEWLRSFVLTGFPWNLIGYTLAFNDYLIQSASIGGTYLLSLLALMGYCVGGIFLYKPSIKLFFKCAFVILFVFTGLFIIGYVRLLGIEVKNYDVVIRVVQPSIPQQMKWNEDIKENNFKEYLSLSATPSERKPDFIIWGETASPFILDRDFDHIQQVADILYQNSYLITGMISYHPVNGRYRPHNSMVVINDKGLVEDYYHKSHLVPFGEYIPLRDYLPEFIKPVANAIGTFGKGRGPKVIKVDGKPSFGGIICYESIFPRSVVDQENRPDFLINLTNDGWYGNSAGPYQHWVAAKFRALEEGIALVRSANNGVSGLISPYGKDISVLGLNDRGFIDFILPKPLKSATLYSVFGNGIILAICFALLVLGFVKKTNRT